MCVCVCVCVCGCKCASVCVLIRNDFRNDNYGDKNKGERGKGRRKGTVVPTGQLMSQGPVMHESIVSNHFLSEIRSSISTLFASRAQHSNLYVFGLGTTTLHVWWLQ